eukprot:c22242_g1_i1 orf=595-1848(-)
MAMASLQAQSWTATSPAFLHPASIGSLFSQPITSVSCASMALQRGSYAYPAMRLSSTHTGVLSATLHMPSTDTGIVSQMRPCRWVFAHQQDVGSSRQSHERDWQHLERCLEAPDATKTGTSKVRVLSTGPNFRVAYQGHAGAYSHAVIDEVFGYGAEAIPCGELSAAFSAVESCCADHALIPIQNSLDGSIHRNYDLLLRHRLHIVAELPWKVRHCLLARPGTHPAQLRRVIGHPQALSHCHQTLAALGFSAQSLHPAEDTASAALHIADSTAIVASSKAAHAFGLHILSDGIQDDARNVTRFLQLAREPMPSPSPHLPCKTTVAFALDNGPSDLCEAMSAFAMGGIKVTNLESRPAQPQQVQAEDIATGALAAGQFKYIFVVDIEASTACTEARTAMEHVESISSFFRVLGSYPVL